MNPALLILPFATGLWNRYGRGEGHIGKAWWWLSMAAVATLLAWPAIDRRLLLLYGAWVALFSGYAVPPWSPMFAAADGLKPSWENSWKWNWMEDIALRICHMSRTDEHEPAGWRRFGVWYGMFRASLMLPGIIGLCWYYYSAVPLVGVAFLSLGLVYYAAGCVIRHLRTSGDGMEISDAAAIPLAEFTMGYGLGCYVIICGAL